MGGAATSTATRRLRVGGGEREEGGEGEGEDEGEDEGEERTGNECVCACVW